MPLRLRMPIDRAWVKARETRKIAEEDAVFLAARDCATTDEERALWEAVIAERARNKAATSRDEPAA